MLKPRRECLLVAACWLCLAVLTVFWAKLFALWLALTCVLFLALIVDACLVLKVPNLVLSRKLPGRFALGEETFVTLVARNRTKRRLQIQLFDGVPTSAEADELPARETLDVGKIAKISYPIRLLQRGDVSFTAIHVQVASPLRLWDRGFLSGETEVVKVYPNYEPVVEYALLATEQKIEQMGIVRKNRAGLSKDFHQLRDYYRGDSLNQIDWKHTARRQNLISRDYQEQRDQTIIIAVDSGRRMRSQDGELSHFDHCLNGMLLLSYIALRQGDSVGFVKFGGTPRWLPPVKGSHQMPTLLNHLYDYDVSLEPSDFRAAAEQIMVSQRKRALVVVLTNLRGEDSEDLTDALAQLRRRHLVVLASLREKSIEEIRSKTEDVESLHDAVTLAASEVYLGERATALAELRQRGIHTIDESAENFAIALCNGYLDLKDEL